jgi:hypothetical protein
MDRVMRLCYVEDGCGLCGKGVRPHHALHIRPCRDLGSNLPLGIDPPLKITGSHVSGKWSCEVVIGIYSNNRY